VEAVRVREEEVKLREGGGVRFVKEVGLKLELEGWWAGKDCFKGGV